MGKVVQGIAGGVVGFFTGGPAGAIAGAVAGFASGAAAERREEAAKRANREQKRALAINNAQQQIQRQRAIRQALAEARVRRALLVSRGFEGGPSGIGQSVTADTGSAIGAALTQQGASFGISQAQGRASQFALEARSTNVFDTISGAAGLFGQVAAANKVGAFEGLFGGGSGRTDFFGASGNDSSNFTESAGIVTGGR